jgi:hypothetical protein
MDTANSIGNPQGCYLNLAMFEYSSKPCSTTIDLTRSWDGDYKEFVWNFIR